MSDKEQEAMIKELVKKADEQAIKLAKFLNSGVPLEEWEPHPDALVDACSHVAYAMVNLGVAVQKVAPGSEEAIRNVLGTVTNCMLSSLRVGREVAGYVPEEKSRLIVPDSNIRMN